MNNKRFLFSLILSFYRYLPRFLLELTVYRCVSFTSRNACIFFTCFFLFADHLSSQCRWTSSFQKKFLKVFPHLYSVQLTFLYVTISFDFTYLSQFLVLKTFEQKKYFGFLVLQMFERYGL